METLFLKDSGALVFDKKEKALYFLLLFFFVAMYIPGIDWLYNVAMWMFVAYSFYFNSISEKWQLLKARKEILIMMFFFLLNAVSTLFSHNLNEGISFLGIRINLFVIPFAIGSIYLKDYLKDRLIAGFAGATAFAAFGCLFWGIYRSLKNNDWSLLYNDNLSEVINFQSIYFAMMVNLAIIGYAYLFVKRSSLTNNAFLAPILIVLLVVHFLLASRMAIIILYSAAFVFACVFFIRKKRFLEGITLIMGLLLAGFLLWKFFPKTINRFKELTYTKFDYRSVAKESHFNVALTADQWNGANIRIAVWQCAWSVVKNNVILGTGLGDKMDDLKKAYKEKGFEFGIQTNRNVHNNYLDIWMSLGIIGLIVFIAGFILLPMNKCIQNNDWFGSLVIICFALSLISETYLDRTIGNTMLAFFMSFISSYKKTPIKNDY